MSWRCVCFQVHLELISLCLSGSWEVDQKHIRFSGLRLDSGWHAAGLDDGAGDGLLDPILYGVDLQSLWSSTTSRCGWRPAWTSCVLDQKPSLERYINASAELFQRWQRVLATPCCSRWRQGWPTHLWGATWLINTRTGPSSTSTISGAAAHGLLPRDDPDLADSATLAVDPPGSTTLSVGTAFDMGRDDTKLVFPVPKQQVKLWFGFSPTATEESRSLSACRRGLSGKYRVPFFGCNSHYGCFRGKVL